MRPDWHEYFMDLAINVARRSTCDRANVGCLIVDKNRRVIATGYNGSIRGAPHCDDVGHLMVDGHCVATVHAEANAIAQAAAGWANVRGCDVYCTHYPCWSCFKLLANSGIERIYYREAYRKDPLVDEYAIKGGILIVGI